MIRKLLIALMAAFVAMGLTLVTTGCEEGSKQESNRYNDLFLEIDEIHFQISQEMILKSSTPRDKQAVTEILENIKSAFVDLSRDPRNKAAYIRIKQAVRTLRDRVQILEKDHATLIPLIRKALDHAYATAREVGIDFYVDWSIYSFRFSRPIAEEGFVSYPQGAWSEDWALDRSYVATRVQNGDAWLIAPAMDLTGVANPQFRIVHTININQNNREPEFKRQEFLKKSFRARVSMDYRGGDPSPEACGCTWVDVGLGPLPSSKDFHSVESPEIDLSRFRGKNVSIALYYDTRDLGRHYVNWNVALFEVSGAGTYEESQGRVMKTHLAYSFGKKELEPFQVVTQTPNSLQWETGGRGNGYEWAIIKNRESNRSPAVRTSSLLLSPRYVLDGIRNPLFSLVEVINHSGNLDLSELKIMISPDYTGGNVLEATWYSIERDLTGEIPERSWDDLTISGVPLGDLEGGKFTLLFWFDSKKDNNVIWELKNFSIEGKGGLLLTEPFLEPPSIPLLEAPAPPPAPPEGPVFE